VKDDLARRSIKFLARLRYLTDLKITRFILRLKGQPRYRLKGQCNRCGACCETPMIQMYWPLFQLRSARWLMRLWHGKINGFVWIGDDKKSHSLIFRCEHWDPETKQCDSYGSRPGMCRTIPVLCCIIPHRAFWRAAVTTPSIKTLPTSAPVWKG